MHHPHVKFWSLLLSGLFCSMVAMSQLLTVSPLFPTDTNSVKIVVDCSKGNQGLYNYSPTSDVYVHVGVITNLSTSTSDWRYVPFQWGTSNPLAQAVYLGGNKYQYTISNIRSFFGVPASETIQKIAILFRNGSGSQAQRNTDGSDMFISVYGSGLSISIQQPPFQPTYNPIPEPIVKNLGDSLYISCAANMTANLKITLNQNIVQSASGVTSLSAGVVISQPGNQWVRVYADNGQQSAVDSFQFYVAAAAQILPLPQGAREGINYLPGDTSALFVLYAPLKHKILMVGDFNGWTASPAYQMNKTPDSNYYWLQVDGLVPGQEYAYQYVIDDSLILADYNTEKVLDKNVDPQIPASTYPNLKTFPQGASGTLASVVQTGQQAYSWQVPQFSRPDKSGLVIYELLIRDFTSQGNYQALTDTLSYLKRLGVNAIELMPFNNFEGASSWGYNPNFYFAPDKVYGTPVALKQFIDACHQQGMAVIMDLVMNHSFGSSPMVQMYFDNALGVPAANSPWFNQYPTHAFNVGYQFNHESPATASFVQRVMQYWITQYHVDGYRFDLAKGYTQKRTCDATGNNCDVNAWGAYDSSRVAIWDTIYNQLQAISPGSYCILEMFADNSEQTVYANQGMLVWGNQNANFNQATMGYNSPSPSGATWDLTGGIYTSLGWKKPGLVVYQESHDEERLMYNNIQYGNSLGSYHVKDTATGLARNGMAAAFWALMPGPKMLWQFGELGYDYSINYCPNGTVDPSGSCRLSPKPVRWDYLSQARRKNLHDVYTGMIQLRVQSPGLDTGQVSYALGGAFKSMLVSSTGLHASVIGNFDVQSATGNGDFSQTGTWYDYFGGDSISVSSTNQTFTLKPGEFHVYLDHRLYFDTTRKDTVPIVTVPSALSLRVYPNPVVQNHYTLEYDLPQDGLCQMAIFNSFGQRMATIDLGSQQKGKHTLIPGQVPLNFSLFPSGTYVIRLVCNQATAHCSLLVLP